MAVVTISDPDDPRVALYRDQTDAALRRSVEAEHGIFMAEGATLLRQVLAGDRHRIRSVLLHPVRHAALAGALATVDPDVPVYLADPKVMDRIAGFSIHRGVLAAVERPPSIPAATLLRGMAAEGKTVAVLEAITDHENVGAVFRNAAAFGVGAILACTRTCDPLYRRSVRVSMGYVLAVPFARLDPWPAALADVVAAGFRILALTPAPDATELRDLTADTNGRPDAVLLGTEGDGLSDAALAAADVRVRIPMAGGVDSLNVATAAALAFHHLRS